MIRTVYYYGGPLDGAKLVKPANTPLGVIQRIEFRYAHSIIRMVYSIRWLAATIYIAQYMGEIQN